LTYGVDAPKNVDIARAHLECVELCARSYYEDGMTKKLTGKETKVTQNPKKPVAAELQDDDLQQVTGGLQSTGPTMPKPPKPCITDLFS
jgi:hypothetical protein